MPSRLILPTMMMQKIFKLKGERHKKIMESKIQARESIDKLAPIIIKKV